MICECDGKIRLMGQEVVKEGGNIEETIFRCEFCGRSIRAFNIVTVDEAMCPVCYEPLEDVNFNTPEGVRVMTCPKCNKEFNISWKITTSVITSRFERYPKS